MDWEKLMDNRWQQQITNEITVLVKNLLIPLTIKTKTNANEFERSLKQEIFEDLEYFQSLEKEVDELESEKAEFSNEYDLLLQECLSHDIMNAILRKKRFAYQVVENNAFTKPVTPHSWPQERQSAFAKPYHVNAPGPSRNSSKRVSFQSPIEFVGSNDMVHNYYLEEAKKKAQIQKNKALYIKPSVITPARLPNTASGSKLKPRNYNQQTRNWPPSHVSNRAVNIAKPPRNSKPFLNSKNLACPTCKKCIYCANHDVQIPIGRRFSPNKTSAVYMKTTPPRSGLTWKPTGRIFTSIGLRWIHTRNSVETYNNTNDSVLPLGNETCTPNTVIFANSSYLSAAILSMRHLALRFPVRRTIKYGESNATALEDQTLRAGNLVKEVLLMNLPDHRYRRWSNDLIQNRHIHYHMLILERQR
ncbi:hypothetical protein Tco_0769104 [Tanacetum coccineum]|uniref:Uncharacterized protein n=1 Tax=Tanacetum coccineum TaxID=301880 RepID=A0ABQ4ZC86_9ASTR